MIVCFQAFMSAVTVAYLNAELLKCSSKFIRSEWVTKQNRVPRSNLISKSVGFIKHRLGYLPIKQINIFAIICLLYCFFCAAAKLTTSKILSSKVGWTALTFSNVFAVNCQFSLLSKTRVMKNTQTEQTGIFNDKTAKEIFWLFDSCRPVEAPGVNNTLAKPYQRHLNETYAESLSSCDAIGYNAFSEATNVAGYLKKKKR